MQFALYKYAIIIVIIIIIINIGQIISTSHYPTTHPTISIL